MENRLITSTYSYQLGGERMIKAGQGLLERQSLEENIPIAHGEDLLASLRKLSIFSKPASAARSHSSTCTSSSSGAETPPLLASHGSSISGGSQSSIDLGHLNNILTNVTQPTSGVGRESTPARARSIGHRRRIEQARMSRSSVYETIEAHSPTTPSTLWTVTASLSTAAGTRSMVSSCCAITTPSVTRPTVRLSQRVA
ncbi:hypothetical protein GY45DRAFT_627104 [Cubamyces sp. BRFM 1775]|nr:hypothetical protein GY45DRAFT_627104 [Cubamyces sp. BRFM 1775]